MNRFIKFIKRISPHKKIVFIVEDNFLYANSLKNYLVTRFPFIKIKTFSVGEACLDELYLNPNFIIMDHILNTNNTNAANGLSIIKKIKEESSKTNIILLSAQTELEVFVKALSEYGCDYLRKDEDSFGKIEQLIRSSFI